jgi:hypothetical protein
MFSHFFHQCSDVHLYSCQFKLGEDMKDIHLSAIGAVSVAKLANHSISYKRKHASTDFYIATRLDTAVLDGFT